MSDKETLLEVQDDELSNPQRLMAWGKTALAIIMASTLVVGVFIIAYVFLPRRADLAERLNDFRERIIKQSNFIENFWVLYGFDSEYGGFYGTLDRTGTPIEPEVKGLIQTSRHLWSCSTWYQTHPSTDLKNYADNLYQFLLTNFLDRTDDQFHYQVERNGTVIQTDMLWEKDLYSQAFTILALSQYSLTFHTYEAATYALTLFQAIDRYAHDGIYGGYNESLHSGMVEVEGGAKDTDTHLHLMEALISLFKATHDDTVKLRLQELVNVTLYQITQPEYYMFRQFMMNWTIIGPNEISFPRDLEAVYLLMSAADELNTPFNNTDLTTITNVGATSSVWGIQPDGSYVEYGIPNPNGTGWISDSNETIWWAQADSLTGLWWMFSLTGDESYLDRFEETLDFIEDNLWDTTYQEWYSTLYNNGTLDSTKGSFWKASYHTCRATEYLPRWITIYQRQHGLISH